MEDFKNILENALTKVCNVGWDDYDLRIPAVIWDYRTKWKKLTSQSPFILVYGQESAFPMEFLVPTLCIAVMEDLMNSSVVEEIISQLLILEEDQFFAGFHQQV